MDLELGQMARNVLFINSYIKRIVWTHVRRDHDKYRNLNAVDCIKNKRIDLFFDKIETGIDEKFFPDYVYFPEFPDELASHETDIVCGYLTHDSAIIDLAAGLGCLEIVEWLHINGRNCTKLALNWAAMNGHLDVVDWLHKNGKECCTLAMDLAAKYGHIHVVEFLHKNRTEGCTTEAMDNAAENGHLEVVRWLHKNRTEGCTTEAMDYSAGNGYLDVVKFLKENRSEVCISSSMRYAIFCGQFEVLKYLCEKNNWIPPVFYLVEKQGHRDIIEYLKEKEEKLRSEIELNAIPKIIG